MTSMAMQDWSLETINGYCKEHFGDDVECVIGEGKGRIMLARKAIKQGDILFQEPPLHIVAEDADNQAFQLVQRLCKKEPSMFDYEPLWYWTALQSLTPDQLVPKPKIGTLTPVNPQQQKRLLCLYHEPVAEASEAVKKIVQQLGLGVSPAVVEELLQAWILNCFEHSEDPLGYSAYFASSFVSHSCGANGIWSEGDDGLHILRARRDITPGDEICISYLPEDVLLQSAEERKKSLKSTKQFDCGCERCAPSPKGAPGSDPCRGFRCPKCAACGVFHQLDVGTSNPLEGVKCVECGFKVGAADAKRMLEAEAALDEQLKKLETAIEKKPISKVLKDAEVKTLLSFVGDQEAGAVGPQHWLCDKLWEQLETWYRTLGASRREEERRMMELRVNYQRKCYFPGPSGTLAWTLEHQADTLLEHLGHGKGASKSPIQDEATKKKVQAQVFPAFEESMRILELMFGNEHEYFLTVEKKYKSAQLFTKAVGIADAAKGRGGY
mmetsp:Transcript_74218/g.133794  ORF Transcript_74218/g.133794 Transcript_74218/m.133794 type:complete len:496 (-) Transcript_74218:61-1548(-)